MTIAWCRSGRTDRRGRPGVAVLKGEGYLFRNLRDVSFQILV